MSDPLKVLETVEAEYNHVADLIERNIIQAGKRVSGKLSARPDVRIVSKREDFDVHMDTAAYFGTLETGRRPTPDVKPSAEMIENFGEWAQAQGMEEGAEWGIATKINQEGTQLWKDGGRKDIFSQYFTPEYTKQICDKVGKVAAKSFAANLQGAVKKKR